MPNTSELKKATELADTWFSRPPSRELLDEVQDALECVSHEQKFDLVEKLAEARIEIKHHLPEVQESKQLIVGGVIQSRELIAQLDHLLWLKQTEQSVPVEEGLADLIRALKLGGIPAEIMEKAIVNEGSAEKAERWMFTANQALGKSPCEVLKDFGGKRKVKDLLDRIWRSFPP